MTCMCEIVHVAEKLHIQGSLLVNLICEHYIYNSIKSTLAIILWISLVNIKARGDYMWPLAFVCNEATTVEP